MLARFLLVLALAALPAPATDFSVLEELARRDREAEGYAPALDLADLEMRVASGAEGFVGYRSLDEFQYMGAEAMRKIEELRRSGSLERILVVRTDRFGEVQPPAHQVVAEEAAGGRSRPAATAPPVAPEDAAAMARERLLEIVERSRQALLGGDPAAIASDLASEFTVNGLSFQQAVAFYERWGDFGRLSVLEFHVARSAIAGDHAVLIGSIRAEVDLVTGQRVSRRYPAITEFVRDGSDWRVHQAFIAGLHRQIEEFRR